MDFGTTEGHLAALVWGCVEYETNPRGRIWVMGCETDNTANVDWVWTRQKALRRLEGVTVWGHDPMLKHSPTFLNSEPMSGSLFSREARVGLCRGLVIADRLRFNQDGQGIVTYDSRGKVIGGLVHNIIRVRRKKQPSGEETYDRRNDDETAAWEDMCAAVFGKPMLNLPKSQKRNRPQRESRQREYSRV